MSQVSLSDLNLHPHRDPAPSHFRVRVGARVRICVRARFMVRITPLICVQASSHHGVVRVRVGVSVRVRVKVAPS